MMKSQAMRQLSQPLSQCWTYPLRHWTHRERIQKQVLCQMMMLYTRNRETDIEGNTDDEDDNAAEVDHHPAPKKRRCVTPKDKLDRDRSKHQIRRGCRCVGSCGECISDAGQQTLLMHPVLAKINVEVPLCNWTGKSNNQFCFSQ